MIPKHCWRVFLFRRLWNSDRNSFGPCENCGVFVRRSWTRPIPLWTNDGRSVDLLWGQGSPVTSRRDCGWCSWRRTDEPAVVSSWTLPSALETSLWSSECFRSIVCSDWFERDIHTRSDCIPNRRARRTKPGKQTVSRTGNARCSTDRIRLVRATASAPSIVLANVEPIDPDRWLEDLVQYQRRTSIRWPIAGVTGDGWIGRTCSFASFGDKEHIGEEITVDVLIILRVFHFHGALLNDLTPVAAHVERHVMKKIQPIRERISMVFMKDLGVTSASATNREQSRFTYRCEFRWGRDMFKWTDTIVYLTNTFFMFLTVQLRVHLIDKRRHFLDLNKRQPLCSCMSHVSRIKIASVVSMLHFNWVSREDIVDRMTLPATHTCSLGPFVLVLLTISCRSVRCWLWWLLFWMASNRSL